MKEWWDKRKKDYLVAANRKVNAVSVTNMGAEVDLGRRGDVEWD